jgi:hypothetical protein
LFFAEVPVVAPIIIIIAIIETLIWSRSISHHGMHVLFLVFALAADLDTVYWVFLLTLLVFVSCTR